MTALAEAKFVSSLKLLAILVAKLIGESFSVLARLNAIFET